jgi:hypothetical protein
LNGLQIVSLCVCVRERERLNPKEKSANWKETRDTKMTIAKLQKPEKHQPINLVPNGQKTKNLLSQKLNPKFQFKKQPNF